MRILLVEDEWAIAMDLVATLESEGFEIAGPASSVKRALPLLDKQRLDGAILDTNLGNETSEPIAQALADLNIPFLVLSGHGADRRTGMLAMAPFLSKPCDIKTLVEALRGMLAGAAQRSA